MKMKVILALAVMSVAGSAGAQVRQVYNGNALDANPQVGVGGANNKVPGGYQPINGNDIMTGNVAGLKSFQGNSPIRNMNEFQGNLGSASLNNFVRQSAGVPLTQTNQGFTQVYYNPNRQVSAAMGQWMPAPINGGFDNKYAPGSSVSVMSGVNNPVNSLNQPLPINAAAAQRKFDDVTARPGDISPLQPSGLFGFRNALQNSSMERPVDKLERERKEAEEERGRTDLGSTQRVGAATQAVASLQQPVDGSVNANPMGLRSGMREEPESEVYASMQKQLKGDVKTATTKEGTPGAIAGTAGAQNLLSGAGSNASGTEGKPLAEQSEETLRAGKRVEPITTFTGKANSLFDQYMAIAEKQLKDGRYLDAAGTYQGAMELSADNPLALIGRAHAQLAAGLYLAAADDLKLLFKKRPELIAVRYDMKAFLPEKRIDFLIKDISQLARGPKANPTANFTLAYLDYQLGNRQEDLKFTLDMWKRTGRKDDEWPDVLRKAWLDK